MPAFGYVVIALVLLVLAWIVVRAFAASMAYRGGAVVTCPETQAHAGVGIDLKFAAATALGSGTPQLRLRECSRWPEREDCGQECLQQIRTAPQNCMIRSMLEKWYANKQCAFCCKPLGQIDWTEHKPGALLADGKTVEWEQVAIERVPDVLASAKPVCWSCHITESFRAERPDLIIERKR